VLFKVIKVHSLVSELYRRRSLCLRDKRPSNISIMGSNLGLNMNILSAHLCDL